MNRPSHSYIHTRTTQKTHKFIHDLATRQPLLDDPNINKGGLPPITCERYSLHLLSFSPDGSFNPFGSFKFTGELRPKYPISPTRIVPEHIPRPDYAEDGTIGRIFHGITRTM